MELLTRYQRDNSTFEKANSRWERIFQREKTEASLPAVSGSLGFSILLSFSELEQPGRAVRVQNIH